MDINDQAIFDRIERLAFQAGINATGAMRGNQAPPEDTKTKRTEVEQRILDNLRVISRECDGYTGAMWLSNNGTHNVEWADIHALLH